MKLLRRLLLIILLLLLVICGLFYYGGYQLYKSTLAKESLASKVDSIKYDVSFVSIDELPTYYKEAVISVEDRRFYEHKTLDVISIGRAIISNIRQKDFKEGGSTLTQQTAKNMYFMQEKNALNRKIAEVLVGIDLEKNYSKDEIFEMYVNTIYFGDGYYGIKQAANGYLHKDPKEMTLSEATMLAGVPNAPSVYAPTKNINLTQSRQKKVISSMLEEGYITQEEASQIELYSIK